MLELAVARGAMRLVKEEGATASSSKNLTQKKSRLSLPNIINIPMKISKKMDSCDMNYLLTKIEKGIKCVYDPTEIGYARHFTNPHKNSLNI